MDPSRLTEEVEADLFEYLPVMLLVTRPDDAGHPVVEDCNERFLDRLGYVREEVVGRRVAAFYTADSAERHRSGGYERARGGRYGREERDFLTAGGNVVSTVVRATPRRVDGEVVGVVAVYVDVTRQKWREQQVKVLNRVLRHNIRNDLNLLHGHARTLARHEDEAVATSARVVGRTVEHWLSLAEKAAEIERVFEEFPDRSTPLSALLRETQTAVELARPSTTVRVEGPADGDVSVSSRLGVALEELCENGVKHAERERPTVAVEATREGERIELTVTDRGPGIPDHERAVLRDGEETSLVHGSGLGLWLVRTIVRRLGGELNVGDADGGPGSVVTVTVPVAPAGGVSE
ncbi:ATP-binding protein [Halogeometricum sp. S1BR25-6]|uniref:histidine kinase n=1 Tax=Halogeometricum salsisoli TaxID=2950536 RepID=A0ABU2GFL4_9EURY|nr:ATP-binding protein [Halogeometricum sp. S1BR25-6]MDS0299256.1 ATP-binding protein [Halogeometricum sp. S1BR25-6]